MLGLAGGATAGWRAGCVSGVLVNRHLQETPDEATIERAISGARARPVAILGTSFALRALDETLPNGRTLGLGAGGLVGRLHCRDLVAAQAHARTSIVNVRSMCGKTGKALTPVPRLSPHGSLVSCSHS